MWYCGGVGDAIIQHLGVAFVYRVVVLRVDHRSSPRERGVNKELVVVVITSDEGEGEMFEQADAKHWIEDIQVYILVKAVDSMKRWWK